MVEINDKLTKTSGKKYANVVTKQKKISRMQCAKKKNEVNGRKDM